MTKKRIITSATGLTAIAILALVTVEFLRGPRSVFARFDRGIQKSFENIDIGTEKSATIEALGEPHSTSKVFNLPQRHGFEHLFDVAEKSNAVEYYLWINGMNWFYCIGFDQAGRVVIKGEGHS